MTVRNRNSNSNSNSKSLPSPSRMALVSLSSHGDEEGDAVTVIGKGTLLVASVLHLESTLIVHGTLKVAKVETSTSNDSVCDVTVGPSGLLQGDVLGFETVQVCGRLVGKVQCARLIIDEQGEVVGDVQADILILRPGGKIQGAIHCSQVGSELKIFEELKRPLQISSDYASSSSPNHRKRISIMTREKAGVALHARSDPHQQLGVQPNKPSTAMGNPNSHEPSAISKPLLDHFGHPLIGSAPMHDVDALRKNRELVQATRAFLDSAMAVKTNDQHQFRVGNTDNDNDTDSNPVPAFLR